MQNKYIAKIRKKETIRIEGKRDKFESVRKTETWKENERRE